MSKIFFFIFNHLQAWFILGFVFKLMILDNANVNILLIHKDVHRNLNNWMSCLTIILFIFLILYDRFVLCKKWNVSQLKEISKIVSLFIIQLCNCTPSIFFHIYFFVLYCNFDSLISGVFSLSKANLFQKSVYGDFYTCFPFLFWNSVSTFILNKKSKVIGEFNFIF